MKDNQIVVKELKSPEDFNSLLNIQELKKQQAIYDHLDKNLDKYKERFLKSYLVDWDKLDSHFSEDDHKRFLKNLNRDFKKEYRNFSNVKAFNSFKEYHVDQRIGESQYIIDYKKKKMYDVQLHEYGQSMDFGFKKNILTVTLKQVLTQWFNYNRPYADKYQIIKFNANDNTFISYKTYIDEYNKR